MMTPSSVDNKFVAHFYNRFTPEIQQELKKEMQRGIPQEVAGRDLEDKVVSCKPHIVGWIESQQVNPAPEDYYTMQINSYEDLKKRTEDSREVAGKLNERITNTIEGLEKYKKTCDDDIQSKIEESQRKNQLI
jgi:Nucleoporin complex subunit 54